MQLDERPALVLPATPAPASMRPIMAGLMLVMAVASLDQTIVGTALPRMIAQLSGIDRYTWVATAYLLTSTITVPMFGKLTDVVGGKLTMIVGLGLFLAGSALCGGATSMTGLIIFRGLQGSGAGALVPVSIAIVGAIVPVKDRAKWQALLGSVWILAALVGPLLGGWIADHYSWRLIFWINLPIGLIAIAVIYRALPGRNPDRPRARIDVAGAALLTLGVVPLLLAFTLAGSAGTGFSPIVAALLLGGLTLSGLFVRHELHHPDPILEPRLFRDRIFTACVLATALINGCAFGSIYFLPLLLQGVLGATATGSGIVLTPLVIAAMAGGGLTGQVLSRTGRYRALALVYALLVALGSGLFVRLSAQARPSDALLAVFAIGIGFGGLNLYVVAAQNAFPTSRVGQVTGTLVFFRTIGATVALAIMGAILNARYTALLAAHLPAVAGKRITAALGSAARDPQLLLRADARAALARALRHAGGGPDTFAHVMRVVRDGLATALHEVFIAGLILALLALGAAVSLREIPLRGGIRATQAGPPAEP